MNPVIVAGMCAILIGTIFRTFPPRAGSGGLLFSSIALPFSYEGGMNSITESTSQIKLSISEAATPAN